MNSIQGKGKRQKASQNKTANKQPKKKTAVRSALEGIGSTLGGLVGLKDLGRDAGSWISKVTGLGEYKVNSNVFAKSSDDVPQFQFNSDGSTTITHRESLGDMKGSINYTSKYYDIHPLNPILFPWLSIEAMGYEQFEFQGLLFCFNSTCGDAIASTNNSMGTVVITTEYDVSRPTFNDKVEMESYTFTSSKKPSESFIHPIECNPKQDIVNARYNMSYYRQQAASTDISAVSMTSNVAENLQCLGRTQVSTVGMQAATTIGELWVTYRIKLSKARAPPAGIAGGFFHASSNNVGTLVPGSAPFGVSPNVISDSSYQTDCIGINSNTVSFSGLRPNTKIFLYYHAEVSSGTSPTFAMAPPTLVGLVDIGEWFNAASSYDAGSGTAQYSVTRCFYVDPNSSLPPTITYPNPTIGGTSPVFKWDLTIHLAGGKVAVTPLLSMAEKESQLEDLIKLFRSKSNPEYVVLSDYKSNT